MGQIGVLLASAGRYAEAIEMLKNAVDLEERNKNLLQKALTLKFMGQTYRKLGNMREAVNSLKNARDIYAAIGDSGAKETKEIDQEILWGSYWQRMMETGTPQS
jgi:tetratricopeptide (TPR) repeat protein